MIDNTNPLNKNEKDSDKKGLIIAFSIILIIALVILSIIFIIKLVNEANKKVVIEDKSNEITLHMLDVVNVDIASEEDKATKITNFAFNADTMNIVATSETQVFFYEYTFSTFTNVEDVLLSFVDNYEEYKEPDYIEYYDKVDAFELDYEDYLVTSSKDDINYHISLLIKTNDRYYPIFNYEDDDNEFNEDISTYLSYSALEESHLSQLYSFILSL